MMKIDAVMFDGALDRLPSFRFNRPARPCAAIVVRRHLGQDAVAQSERE
jgi:hypothetical protein